MAPSQVSRINVHLNDLRMTWIELPPGEVRPQQQQRVAAENAVIGRFHTDEAGHSNVVRIVVFQRILAPGGMCHRCPQTRRELYYFIMCVSAAGTGVDCDIRAFGKDGRHLIEISLAWTDDRLVHMDAEGRL